MKEFGFLAIMYEKIAFVMKINECIRFDIHLYMFFKSEFLHCLEFDVVLNKLRIIHYS